MGGNRPNESADTLNLQGLEATSIGFVDREKPTKVLTTWPICLVGDTEEAFAEVVVFNGADNHSSVTVRKKGKTSGKKIEADKRCSVGRSDQNKLVIEEGNVSREHCSVQNRDNTVRVFDCGSKHGTSFDGEPIQTEHCVSAEALAKPGSRCVITLPNDDVAIAIIERDTDGKLYISNASGGNRQIVAMQYDIMWGREQADLSKEDGGGVSRIHFGCTLTPMGGLLIKTCSKNGTVVHAPPEPESDQTQVLLDQSLGEVRERLSQTILLSLAT